MATTKSVWDLEIVKHFTEGDESKWVFEGLFSSKKKAVACLTNRFPDFVKDNVYGTKGIEFYNPPSKDTLATLRKRDIQ